MRFENKAAIVTGGASGIGEATVRAFAAEGAKVVIADFSDRGAAVSEELNGQGFDTLFVKTNVAEEASVKAMVAATVKKYGRLDILFANAGIGAQGVTHELSMKDWQRMIDINLTGVFLCDKYAIDQMLKQGTGGVVVNCGSIHSHVARSTIPAYSAAKGGVKLLTQSTAIAYAQQNIRVNAVCPGYIDTPLIQGGSEEARQYLINLHPMGRLGKPEEIAKSVLFLASEDASFITGTTLTVDGGYTAQ
ncbi:NAD(P)-dependent dehydrogenase (short-subunit alcohol dehydrogenase family) [Paenibacillus sp. BK033]|uniref:SDR family NAD(P)-dependent oxidoreductase n=1 Tax=Paenibacillus sp. BK033 TaxID=2512133 RepID=UPI0010483068|nr:glucose 1-dehydrogenase [Paenibacillus sp. BK033]TCM89145.1 NAD(P)-dependent dehydrogenase (short-subunit alcohol dehydrogenase family) [Paenibacillus sp. BK033]